MKQENNYSSLYLFSSLFGTLLALLHVKLITTVVEIRPTVLFICV